MFTLISSRTSSVVKLGADWVLRFVLCMEREKNQSIDIDKSITEPLPFRWHYIQNTTLNAVQKQ